MTDRVCLWISSYRKECGKKHQQQRMDTDLEKLATPEQLTQFRRSQPALSAIKFIDTSDNGLKRVVQGEYVNLRDFLLTEIANTTVLILFYATEELAFQTLIEEPGREVQVGTFLRESRGLPAGMEVTFCSIPWDGREWFSC